MMIKSFFILLIVVVVSSGTFAQQNNNSQEFETKISAATVYLSGAELVRNHKISVKKGRTELVFKNLSPKINTKSIRVTTSSGVEILSITSKINYLTKIKVQPRIRQLNDSLAIVADKIQLLEDKKNAYQTEKEMLLQNTAIGGENNGVNITDLKEASDFYRTRITEINTELSKFQKETAELTKTSARLKRELDELNAKNQYMRTEVKILVESQTATTTDLELKYIVNGAGWSPSYDIRAEDTDKPVQLVYRAKVFNNTDIDWENLQMTLSTADPSLDVTQPNLQPWYLNDNSFTYSYKGGYRNSIQNNEGYTQNYIQSEIDYTNAIQDISEDNEIQDFGGNEPVNPNMYADAAVPELNAEFKIDKPYSVPSDDKPYLVDVNEFELPATFQHFAVTKLDKDVFLLARITGWEDLDLVEGPANVYYSGTYLGQSFIRTRNVSDTLDLSLGIDGKVIVTRSKLKDYSKTQFIGSKRKDTHTYELVAKNNRKSSINIEILDQVPISQSQDIEVKILETTDAVYNETTGELSWNFKLAPGESKKITLSYSVKYPKSKKIQIHQRKSRKVRYF